MQESILSVKSLTISFGDKDAFTAVDNISFELGKGRTLAIVGESGSGKSLTALALTGLLPQQAHLSGGIELRVDDAQYQLDKIEKQEAWQQLRGKEIGMIFQEPMSSLNPVMKVGQQLTETLMLHQHIGEQEAKALAIVWFNKVKLPNPERIFDRYPHQLSGGQKQRVMIAIAMCNNPALLIADEPTTALDVTVQKEVVELMKELQKEHGTAMIFITHDLALAAETADEVLVMYKGVAREYGYAEKVLKTPDDIYTRALLACRPSVQEKGKKLPTIADFLDIKQAGSLPIPQPETKAEQGDTLLQVNNLKVWFAEKNNWLGKPVQYFKAVDDVSFELRKGEVLGLVGESGCGKSTISRSLMGLLPVYDGQVIFKGQDLAKIKSREWQRVRRQIQIIFQDPYASLNPRMTIGDTLREPMQVHSIVPANELDKEARRLLDIVHLPADSFKRYPHQFSGGQRQRIGIARALAIRPEIIICDESVSALDVSVQAQILNLLTELKTEFDLSYLFVSHDLSVVHYISDRVMVMQAGKIVETGEATQVLTYPVNAYTQRLVSAMP